ncbi:hypothetical protein [Cohnella cellulosilytica]|uniref:Lipoprotein n=1 Tax=Cohnella cellulosilytica TaxID=986710 RepID=A0ABW2F5L2_9BACL
MKKALLALGLVLLLSACASGGKGSKAEYIPEDAYAGDELDIVRLINQRIKYSQDDNESEYLKLFYADSPINGLPNFKLRTVRLTEDIGIQEQKQAVVAVVLAEDVVSTGESFTSQYVFIKSRLTDDVWKIWDID